MDSAGEQSGLNTQKADNELNTNVADTFSAIFEANHSCVSWDDMIRAMKAIGYEAIKKPGTHTTFRKTPECLLPDSATNITLAGTHGKTRSQVPRAKTKSFGQTLKNSGVDWDKIQEFYIVRT